MRRLNIVLLLAFLLMSVSFLSPQPASAHGYLVRSIPENRAVFERPPNRLQYWFSESLEPNFSKINLRNQAGDIIATGGRSENDDRLLTLQVPDLPDGAYIVELRPAFASDGHTVAESRVFFVGEEIGGVAGQGLTDKAIPLEVISRFISMASSIVLFGASALYAWVLVPAWGSAKYPAGNLPPRVMRQLNILFAIGLFGAIVGNLIAMVQQTMAFFNIDFFSAMKPEFWQLVRVGSRFGDIWNWRMVFLVIAGVLFGLSIYQRNSQPRTVRAYWTANLWLLALVLGSHSILSHAAGSLLWPWMAVGTNWLHILAVGFWAGALVVLVMILPTALQPYDDADIRRQVLLAVLNKFSPVAMVSLVVVTVTGIYSATNWIFTPSDVQTTFGGALILKLVLVFALVALGGLHFIALNPARYARFNAITARVSGFMPTLRLEAVFVVAVLGSASFLSATPIPQPEFLQEEVKTPTQQQKADDLTIEMSLIPGGLGVNTFDVYVAQNRGHLNVVDINLVNVFPASAYRSERHTLEDADFSVFATVTDDIQVAGKWWSLVDITLFGEAPVRYAFEWDIDGTAGVIQSIEPTIINWFSLALVIVTLTWLSYPFLKRWLALLNWDIASVSVAFATIAMTVIMMVGGYVYIQQTRDDYAKKINQPASAVNIALPDQASLDRGRQLYGIHCRSWQIFARDFENLNDRLLTMRDDELYQVIMEGWRELPQCGRHMTEDQRWDVVNYLRVMPLQTATGGMLH
jgi:copper transport protein